MVLIKEMLISNKKSRPFRKITPTFLVIHWTANEGKGANAESNRNYFQNAERAASAHYCVDSGEIVQCIPEAEMAYHVGADTYTAFAERHIGSYPNAHTIGVEMCVNSDGHFWTMYSNTVKLCIEIMKRHNIPIENVIRHYDVTGKDCPAFFVEDKKALQYTKKSAAIAWKDFLADIKRLY